MDANRRYANKPEVRLYGDFEEYNGASKRDDDGKQLARSLRHLWDGNRHVRARV